MAVNHNDPVTKALPGTYVDNRLINWLWFYIQHNYPTANIGEYKSHGMKDRMADLINTTPNLKTDIKHSKDLWLIPDQKTNWITNDERQQKWLNPRILEKRNLTHLNSPPNLMGRDFTIALIDTWAIDKYQKETTVSEIERAWGLHTQSDKIFKWFDDQDEFKKTSLAWEIIQKKSPLFVNNPPIKNLQDLIIFFDGPYFSLPEKILTIEAVKKRWSQNRYREKQTGKKQYNFILSDKTIRRLDKLADKHDLKRTEVLEILLQMEEEKELYIKEKKRFSSEI
ncbi:hypothetical protein [Pseudomonas sp. 6D_7.1_Bac1]|uniref:hypothetical protein n=1 Tax=Pseudomonas sp. 6D_7.1_Bac1 TaxID=2971615 RepID=UPI0021C8E69F|nr:hypothetical protein [Pseudomonas sp. 6D_7.1_Bac1]MCU1748600.1 hypothetical protein [Pseudomonas sp. 6D_7.1_Bac1]